MLERPLNSFFGILYKKPNDQLDIIDITQVLKHCIVFYFNDAIIVTEISSYREHD